MTVDGWLQLVVLVGVLSLLAPPLGRYMARVYEGGSPGPLRVLVPVERALCRLCGADLQPQSFRGYASSLVWFSAASFLALYVILRSQAIHPLNPQGFTTSMPWQVAFNTAASFVSNTSWQFYGGETTLSYFSQMAGITVASFTSMAVGMAAAAALVRGLAARGTDRIGNFWTDLVRSLLYVIMPLCAVASILLVACGVPQTLGHYLGAHGITGVMQTIAIGPVASQEAIKLMSGDGGGFFNVNSAHPFENPNGTSNLLEMLLMLIVPAACVFMFGRMTNRRRQGWVLYAVMLVLFVGGSAVLYASETHGTPAQRAAGLHLAATSGSSGGNMEGKEERFGIAGSALFVAAGTASGDGAVNSAVESYGGTGLAVAMANLMSGEIIFGGPGSGLYGMLGVVVLAVFVAGLMVGRTPEYLGKQVQAREVKLAMIATLVAPFLALGAAAVALATPIGRESISVHGPQGFAESVYAYLSQAQNNGSAMAGYTGFVQPVPGNVGSHALPLANLLGAAVMMFGRFIPMLAMLALGASLGTRRIAPAGLGTLRTDTPTFGLFLTGFIAIVVILTFLTALVLGPFAPMLSHHLW